MFFSVINFKVFQSKPFCNDALNTQQIVLRRINLEVQNCVAQTYLFFLHQKEVFTFNGFFGPKYITLSCHKNASKWALSKQKGCKWQQLLCIFTTSKICFCFVKKWKECLFFVKRQLWNVLWASLYFFTQIPAV